MNVTRTVAGLRDALDAARAARRTIALVPTMGALHEGHLRLCDEARRRAEDVVLSVFVNPLQFGPGEDFERYPRDLDADAELARGRGVTHLFAPLPAEMYPLGDAAVRVHAPGLDTVLCGRFRPGHFEGVLTVVAKLFNMVRPDCAVFGQKDLQQAILIRRMVHDLDFAIDVVIVPIVREADGLALSSRNAYLSADERASALALHRALEEAGRAFADGENDPARLADIARAILVAEPGVEPQYVEVVDPATLGVPERVAAGHAVAVAAFVGRTRLIDNLVLS